VQGLTIGKKYSIKRTLSHWTIKCEAQWANILYVGASRSEELNDFALANDISSSDLGKIGKHPSLLKQKEEMNILANKARQLREIIDITPQAFCDDMRWVIDEIKRRTEFIPEVEAVRKITITKYVYQWEQLSNNGVK
jgi:hypothetical protein